MALETKSTTVTQTSETTPVIQMEGVGVRYRVAQESIPSFKEYFVRWIKREIQYQSFWALDDITVSINRGEVFGIVGQNGAGKSTLLKVVARVLRPTTGRIRINGRVAPLLELGAGFDRELTGRENIYLNGAILGFSEQDLKSRVDRIVEFAGLEDFIDAPLRTYSTGMTARLGFSIATDVRPEILIVDEILGVGDAAFQTKSYERIKKYKGEGTTILLVTHSLSSIKEMCSRAMWLNHGKAIAIGDTDYIIHQYTENTTEQEAQRLVKQAQKALEKQKDTSAELSPEEVSSRRWGSRQVEIGKVLLTDETGEAKAIFNPGDQLVLHIGYTAHEPIPDAVFGLAIHRHDSLHITGPNTDFANFELPTLQGQGRVTYTIPRLPLLTGLYEFTIAIVNKADDHFYDFHNRLYPFRVVEGGDHTLEKYGLMMMGGDWIHQSL